MSDGAIESTLHAERVQALLRFASGVLTARDRVQMRMADTRLGVFRQEEVTCLPGVFVGTEDGDWLRLKRQIETAPKAPPAHVAAFLPQSLGNPDTKPALVPAIALEVTIEEASDLEEAGLLRPENINPIVVKGVMRADVVRATLLAADLREMQRDFAAWLSEDWAPWAEREQPVRRSIDLYNALFRIHSAIHAAEGVPPEVIWGFGIGLWNTQDQAVDMPIVEQEVEIEVLSGGDMVLVPRNRPLELSLKPYLQLEVDGSARLQTKLSELLAVVRQGDASVSPAGFSALDPILETAASELDSGGRYLRPEDLDDSVERAEEKLKVLGRWAVYVRPRSSATRVQDLEALARAVEEAGVPPAALKGFVAPEPDQAPLENPFGLDSAELGASRERSAYPEPVRLEPGMRVDDRAPLHEARPAEAYFFPLPFNEEQAQIVDMLEGRRTGKHMPVVSVTGPPGTGKSHTIANLISHAMARGKRVLVTARTAEAISVVREKLPKSLQPLVIASTGTDRESAELLKAAVSELSDEVVALDIEKAKRERDELEAKILDCDRVASEADQKLSAIARMNLERVGVDDTAVTPMELARRVAEGRDSHGWFEDRPEKKPPTDLGAILERLGGALPELAPDMDLAATEIPDASEIPGARELIEAHSEEAAHTARAVLDPSAFPPMVVDTAQDVGRARDLMDRVRTGLQDAEALDTLARTLFDAACRSDRRDGLERAQRALGTLMLDPSYERVRYGRAAPLADLIGAAERGASGQKPAPGLFNRTLKTAVGAVSVFGEAPKGAEDWQLVLGAMRLEVEGPKIEAALEGLPDRTDWIRGAAWGWEWSKVLSALKNQLNVALELAARFRGFASEAKAFFPVGMDLEAVACGQAEDLALAIEAHAPEGVSEPNAKTVLREFGRRGSHQLFGRLKALGEALGQDTTDLQDLVRERADITAELERVARVLNHLREADSDLAALAKAGAPVWADLLRSDPIAAGNLIPDGWPAAWRWAVAAGRLDAVISLGNGDALRKEKADALKRRGLMMERLIRVRTMLGLKGRMTSSVQRAMQAFTQAVARVGKGTGKTAPRYRAAAQRAAREVAVAAPVWIMPEHRIAEQLPPEIEAFDLVILDEASQSDVTAVAALARGRQVLVVGDEQQVSPTNVGIPVQKINALRAEHMADLPNADLVDENTSIFEITMRMHPESHVILREHFRCVAPIINFSAQFYSNRLIPLRVARPSERFDPPLVDVVIEDAERRGKTNPREAAWIVDEVAELTRNPSHDARDIGIVSLIGAEQARLIETRLLEDPRIGPEVIKKRRIICGDARTMQGQERSVMFLSMVATPDAVISQTTKDIQQRLNVAMSRARDRVYLVRSVREENLKPHDLKLKVLKHFQDPMPEGTKIAGADLMERCDSGFEREVLGRLLDAGYRAIPQVAAGAYRIDIVVEGAEDRRLAIELDGDAYHGPERWAEDMARQAALERAGWVFWRVFGSQWEAEKEHWWSDLLEALKRMSIDPIGSAAVNDAFVELRLVSAPEATGYPEDLIPEEEAVSTDAPLVAIVDEVPGVLSEGVDRRSDTPMPTSSGRRQEARAGAVGDLFSRTEQQTREIEIGALVRLEKHDGEIIEVVIVRDQPNPEQGRISASSPLGEALLGAFEGEEVEFAAGDHVKNVRVLEVRSSQAA